MDKKWCGTINYQDGLLQQEQAYQICKNSGVTTLLGLEHTPVITLGKRLQASDSEIKLAPPGFEICYTDRGGQATLHSPGQLVVYPVLNIRRLGISVRDYVCVLERAAVATLKQYSVESHIVDGEPGVFTVFGKIAFLGIRVRDGITQHGLSLNIQNDLSLFNSIRACGKDLQTLDSVQNHNINATPKQVFEEFSKHFQALLHPLSLTKPVHLKECITS